MVKISVGEDGVSIVFPFQVSGSVVAGSSISWTIDVNSAPETHDLMLEWWSTGMKMVVIGIRKGKLNEG